VNRSPGTAARVLLFLASLAAYAAAITIAFPPGAPDRLPILALSIAVALAAAQRWTRGAVLLAVLFPCVGAIARLTGGSDPAAWPQLLFWGFAAGWTFRFLYDFETRPDPTRADAPLKALLALWGLSGLLAAARARTLWALWHGLSGRTVNMEGLPESTALRESLLSFGSLACGGVWFLLLRRSGSETRRGALRAALVGVAVSAGVALLQRLSILPGEMRPFWRMTGRLSGASSDPNSLGLLCGLALLAGGAVWSRGGTAKIGGALAVLVFGTGLILSGSRSGLLVAAASPLLYAVTRRASGGLRVAGLFAGAALLLLLVLAVFRAHPGTLGARITSTFDSGRTVVNRASARPILWNTAWRVFREHPIAGAGIGVFGWELPDLVPKGIRLPFRDNPGSAYFQALAETGLVGLAVTLLFLAALVGNGLKRLARPDGDPTAIAASLAVLAFVGALAVGSHWLSADIGLFFFLLAAISSEPLEAGLASAKRAAGLAAAVALYGIAAGVSALSTARPEETFRYDSRIGFYPPEGNPIQPFRWTRQRFAVEIPPGGRERFALANFSPVGLPVGVMARSGKRVLLRTRVAPGGSTVLEVRGSRSRPAVVLFALSRSFVPKRLGIPGGDPRQLGLQAVFLPR